jgi:hypothetical protein
MPVTREGIDEIEEADLEAMQRYGITRVPAAVYLVGPYRYSKLADALAEAKRREIAF